MDILIISQYYYPEQFRINDLAEEWVARGHNVKVITGIPNYPKGSYYDGYGLYKNRRENHRGVEIIRLPIIPRGNTSIQLVFNYFSFIVSGFVWALFSRIKADAVFIFEVSPMTQALPGVWFAKWRRIPCYLYVTDLWPENVEYLTGISSKLVIGPLGSMVKYIYKRCKRVFVSSRCFVDSVVEKGVDEDCVEYWPYYAENFYRPIQAVELHAEQYLIPQDGRFNIAFAGNMGTSQGLDVLIGALKATADDTRQKIRFCMIGEGRYKGTLIEHIKSEGLDDNFVFYAQRPPEDIPYLFAQCQAALICLTKNPVYTITIPSKTQSCMACGKPIVLSADGEVQRIILEARCGVVADAGDAVGLADGIQRMLNMTPGELSAMGKAAFEYAASHFNRAKLNDRILEVFEAKDKSC